MNMYRNSRSREPEFFCAAERGADGGCVHVCGTGSPSTIFLRTANSRIITRGAAAATGRASIQPWA